MRLTSLGEEAYAAAFPAWERTQEGIVRATGRERFGQLLDDLFSLSRSASRLAWDTCRESGVDPERNELPTPTKEY